MSVHPFASPSAFPQDSRLSPRHIVSDTVVLAGLVALGVAGRFWFRDIPNFTPTTALALFAGFYFSRRWMAAVVPLSIMVLSNLWLPSYQSGVEMMVIYAALVLPVVLGHLLRQNKWMGVAAIAPSLFFYLVSNLAVWGMGTLYARTPEGLLECYYYGLPFYRSMLLGDMIFGAVIFGAYALARASLVPARSVRAAMCVAQ